MSPETGQPITSEEIAEQVHDYLERASARHQDVYYATGDEKYESLSELVPLVVDAWIMNYGVDEHREVNTKELLALPEEELSKYGPDIDLLRGYVSSRYGDDNSAIEHFETAQAGYLESETEGSLSKYATASSMVARSARKLGFVDVAVAAHRIAIQGYRLDLQRGNDRQIEDGQARPETSPAFDYRSLHEYRSLAKTLGSQQAVAQGGSKPLKQLKAEVEALQPISQYEAVDSVLVLMQIEKELSHCSPAITRNMHYRRARQYGFICDAFSLGGYGSIGRIMKILATGQAPELSTATVGQWASSMQHQAPDMLGGGPNHFGESDANL